MLKELSWYIETNRFTNIVEEIEEKAAAYSEALKTDELYSKVVDWLKLYK